MASSCCSFGKAVVIVAVVVSISLAALAILSISATHALSCSSQKLDYSKCVDLPTLNSFLHWTYYSSNSSLAVAFIAPPSGWISWAINPTGSGMAGAQALLAFKNPNGSMAVKTFNISSNSADSIVEGNLAFEVWDAAAEYSPGGFFKLFAKVKLQYVKEVNHVWQVGPSVSDTGFPAKHALGGANLQAKGTLTLTEINTKLKKKRNIHGNLNGVSWGVMLPIGIMIARYMRTWPSADPAWFYLHVFCQLSAYIIGVAGWATGMKLGSESDGVVHTRHRYTGISIFSIATLQILCALFLKPEKDHKYRRYWNESHQFIGFVIVFLSIFNVASGIRVLKHDATYLHYTCLTALLLAEIVFIVEAVTRILKNERPSS